MIFSILSLFNTSISKSLQKNVAVTQSEVKFTPYPIALGTEKPYLSAKSAIVLDADSRAILFSKNPDLRFSMASTVKIMTALVALDYYKDDSILTIKSPFVEGSGLHLELGQNFYFKDLMYAMLLPSANDAANAIAQNYPGGISEFVSKMNEKASTLHLNETSFSDPIGLDDDKNYTTVVDLSRLGAQALKNKEFAEIVATAQKTILTTDYLRQYSFGSLNKLLGINGVNGIKTGTTEGAGEVLVTSAFINDHTYIIVVMNSEDRFGDTALLLDFIENNVTFVNLSVSPESF